MPVVLGEMTIVSCVEALVPNVTFPINVGEVLNTTFPVPVSSLITSANSAEVVAAKTLSLFAVYATVPPVPKDIVELSVPEKVTELLALSVFPLAIVNVALVVGAVIVTLFILVAVAAPKVGVMKTGLVVNAKVVPVPLVE